MLMSCFVELGFFFGYLRHLFFCIPQVILVFIFFWFSCTSHYVLSIYQQYQFRNHRLKNCMYIRILAIGGCGLRD